MSSNNQYNLTIPTLIQNPEENSDYINQNNNQTDNINQNYSNNNNNANDTNSKSKNNNGKKRRRTNYRDPEHAAKLAAALEVMLNQKNEKEPKDLKTVASMFDIPYNTLRDNYMRSTIGTTVLNKKKKTSSDSDGKSNSEMNRINEKSGVKQIGKAFVNDHNERSGMIYNSDVMINHAVGNINGVGGFYNPQSGMYPTQQPNQYNRQGYGGIGIPDNKQQQQNNYSTMQYQQRNDSMFQQMQNQYNSYNGYDEFNLTELMASNPIQDQMNSVNVAQYYQQKQQQYPQFQGSQQQSQFQNFGGGGMMNQFDPPMLTIGGVPTVMANQMYSVDNSSSVLPINYSYQPSSTLSISNQSDSTVKANSGNSMSLQQINKSTGWFYPPGTRPPGSSDKDYSLTSTSSNSSSLIQAKPTPIIDASKQQGWFYPPGTKIDNNNYSRINISTNQQDSTITKSSNIQNNNYYSQQIIPEHNNPINNSSINRVSASLNGNDLDSNPETYNLFPVEDFVSDTNISEHGIRNSNNNSSISYNNTTDRP